MNPGVKPANATGKVVLESDADTAAVAIDSPFFAIVAPKPVQ
jgi:hypothetical protein